MTRKHWHERFPLLGSVRRLLRNAYFSALRQALATDEGRELLFDSMSGWPTKTPQLIDVDVPPYEELAAAQRPSPADSRNERSPGPIFISGRFRSGTTLLWNLFRQAGGFTAYYEPLNERRWFDSASRGTRTDSTHLGVNDYWAEYEGLDRRVEQFDAHWHDRHLWMDAQQNAASLRAYLQTLIDAATERPVLQFNRVDFRLPWLRRQFPEAMLLHVYRHPRDQWLSTLGGARNGNPQISMAEYNALDGFYLAAWAEDLKYTFGILDPAVQTRPYELYYTIWKLSYLAGRQHADYSFSIESVWTEPEAAVGRLLRAVGADDAPASQLANIVQPQPTGNWRAFAPAEWWAEQEAAAEQRLTPYLL